MQYTLDVLFNTHCHIVDLISKSLLKGISNQHIRLENSVLFSVVCGKDEGNGFTCCFISSG